LTRNRHVRTLGKWGNGAASRPRSLVINIQEKSYALMFDISCLGRHFMQEQMRVEGTIIESVIETSNQGALLTAEI